jgi:hypothetical protein
MRKHIFDNLEYANGDVAAGIAVSVWTDATATTLATLYAAATGATTLSNPLVSDAKGYIECWVEDGQVYATTPGDSTPRPLHVIGGDLLSVKDYGIEFNGTHDDTDNWVNLLGLAETAGGTILMPPGPTLISGPIVVPSGVNLWGSGQDYAGSAVGTRFLCGSADATVKFEGTGGLSGNFDIDGDGNAEVGLTTGLIVGRQFMNIQSRHCGIGHLIEQAQNNGWMNIGAWDVDYGFLFDKGAASNELYRVSVDSYGIAAVRFQQVGTNVGIPANPWHNHFYGGVIENAKAGAVCTVSHGAGNGNGFLNVNFSPGPLADEGHTAVIHSAYEDDATECVNLQFTGGIIQGNLSMDAFDLGANAKVVATGVTFHYLRYLVTAESGAQIQMVSPQFSEVGALAASTGVANSVIVNNVGAPMMCATPSDNSDATVLHVYPDTLAGATFRLNSNGILYWGSGSSWTMDTVMYRSGAGELYTPGVFKADKLQVFSKNGIPSDADFDPAPPDNIIVKDTLNHRLYTRTGGVWEYVAFTT